MKMHALRLFLFLSLCMHHENCMWGDKKTKKKKKKRKTLTKPLATPILDYKEHTTMRNKRKHTPAHDPLEQTFNQLEKMEESIAFVIFLENEGSNDDIIYANKLRVVKTLYVANVEMLRDHHELINSGETFSSLHHGMVPNKILTIVRQEGSKWTEQITPARKRNTVQLDRTKDYMKSENDLGMLTDMDKGYIRKAYTLVSTIIDKDAPAESTHHYFHDEKEFPEYVETPKGKETPIFIEQICMKKFKMSEKKAMDVVINALSG